jgi:mannose-6-phosphate isomerase-like protein (cupin superfamily)
MKGWYLGIGFVVLAVHVKSQNHFHTDSISTKAIDAITVQPLAGDSLVSSFLITIRTEVKLHKHATHSEHVVVMEGEGIMVLGEKQFMIKKNDVVFIPKNTFHAVRTTSNETLKVVSIQAPKFDGSDRIFKEQNK